MNYSLVHILSGGHETQPLVQSQTFMQAVHQVVEEGMDKPDKVEVWYFTGLRDIISSKERTFLKSLRLKFPDITIRPIYGIERFNELFSGLFFWYYRLKIQSNHVIFHCRTEYAHKRLNKYIQRKHDLSVIDIRGYWPTEKFDRLGLEQLSEYNEIQKKEYWQLHQNIINEVEQADGIVAVTKPLADLVSKDIQKKIPTNIIPCATSSIVNRFSKSALLERLGLAVHSKIIVYSGGYARYQHLEDLTLPFVQLLLTLNPTFHFLVLSFKLDIIKPLVEQALIPKNQVSYLSANQDEVADILSGCDLGLLIRKPTLVNQVAQPVKVGEYLAAGVPLCFHQGVSGASEEIKNMDAGIEINIVGLNQEVWMSEAKRVAAFLEKGEEKKGNAIALAKVHFMWPALVLKQRSFYQSLLQLKFN